MNWSLPHRNDTSHPLSECTAQSSCGQPSCGAAPPATDWPGSDVSSVGEAHRSADTLAAIWKGQTAGTENSGAALGHQTSAPAGSGDLLPPLKVLDDVPSLCTATQAVMGHRAQHEAALSALVLPLQDSSGLYIYSFLSAAAIKHVNFAVMQGLLFSLRLSATAAAGCPCQKAPVSQGSPRDGPSSPLLPVGMQPDCPQGS